MKGEGKRRDMHKRQCRGNMVGGSSALYQSEQGVSLITVSNIEHVAVLGRDRETIFEFHS